MFFLCQVFATAIIMVYFLQFFLISQVTEACAEPFQIYKVDFFCKNSDLLQSVKYLR